jgi:hypothetical protein
VTSTAVARITASITRLCRSAHAKPPEADSSVRR